MAEVVQQRIEEMVGELNQLQNLGCFTTSEIRDIVRKRKALEYKLRRKTKEKQDFIQYIKYELSILTLIQRRRKANKCVGTVREIEVPIKRRIHKLFDMACSQFKFDTKLWLSHIEFCKQKHEKKNASRLFVNLLKIHPHKPDLWILAAKYELEMHHSMVTARGLLQQAISVNPESQHLWLQYFQMELLNSQLLQLKLKDIKDTKFEAEVSRTLVLSGEAANIVYKNACLHFPDDIKLRLAFLDIAWKFGFTEHIKETIYYELKSNFPSDELACSAVARRPLCEAIFLSQQYNDDHKDKIKQLGQETVILYEAAVVSLPTETMWIFYLETCLEIIQWLLSTKHYHQNVRQMLNIFERAQKNECLSENLALSWLQVLCNIGQVSEALRVSRTLTETFMNSTELWSQQILLMIQSVTDRDSVLSCIYKAIEACISSKAEHAVKMWKTVISWCIKNYPDEVITLCEHGLLAQSMEVCLYIRQVYMDFVISQGDIHTVRTLYRRLSTTSSLSFSLVESYITFELNQVKPKMKEIYKVYEEALVSLGSRNVEIWLNFIRIELQMRPENVALLSWRAEKDLDPSLTDEFKLKFAQLRMMPLSHEVKTSQTAVFSH